jgi:hypothetical protein
MGQTTESDVQDRTGWWWRGAPMIVSHDLRMIFLKTKKTAGTSLELSLSSFCGPLDVITPVTLEDEALRSGPGPRNYVRVLNAFRRARPDGVRLPDKNIDFFNHMPARMVRDYVGARLWKRYLKVAFVRNPWDLEVSRYFFKFPGTTADPAAFRTWLSDEIRERGTEWDIISLDDALALDFVGRYETLEADFHRLLRELGVKGPPPQLGRAKVAQRPAAARDYRAFYDDRTRDQVAQLWSKEIKAFGYEF